MACAESADDRNERSVPYERLLERLELFKRLAVVDAPKMFYKFISYVYPNYDCQWFHKVIADHCQLVVEDEIKNLMVFVPPQHGKSTIVSQCFPAWVLGRNPDMKIVGTSYAATLAEQFSRRIQRLMDRAEYAEIFPDTFLNGSNVRTTSRGYLRNVNQFEPVGHQGFYKAVGVGGSLTGTPADIAIIDDPVKDAAQAYSPAYRNGVWNWYNSVLLTRLHNKSKQILIMTRWHEDDLAGRILDRVKSDWTVVSLPAICEEQNDGGLSKRNIGESLWEERHSLEKLAAAKELAPSTFAALYQQRPVIEGGNIVKRDWFGHIGLAEFESMRFREPMHFYLDTAFNKRKPNTDNDPSGIIAACKMRNNIYVFHAQRVWKEMPDLLRFLPEYVSAHHGNAESVLHIEPKANGISVVHMLRELTSLNVRETPTPTEDKAVRLRVVSPRIECGRVFLVEGAWNEDFLTEVCGFPAQPHDEFVDVLGYAINDLLEDDDGIDYYKFSNLNFH